MTDAKPCKTCRHFTVVDNGAGGIAWCTKFYMEVHRDFPECLEHEKKEE